MDCSVVLAPPAAASSSSNTSASAAASTQESSPDAAGASNAKAAPSRFVHHTPPGRELRWLDFVSRPIVALLAEPSSTKQPIRQPLPGVVAASEAGFRIFAVDPPTSETSTTDATSSHSKPQTNPSDAGIVPSAVSELPYPRIGERCRRAVDVPGGVRIVTVLDATNIIAYVIRRLPSPTPPATNARQPVDRVVVWDDATAREIVALDFVVGPDASGYVRGVRLRYDRIIVITTTQLHVFTFSPRPAKVFSLETGANSFGLLAVSKWITPGNSSGRAVCIVPGKNKGHAMVVDLLLPCSSNSSTRQKQRQPLFDSKHSSIASTITLESSALTMSPPTARGKAAAPFRHPPITHIAAHNSSLQRIAVSPSGKYVATASIRGTLVRVFTTTHGTRVAEFRRGAEEAVIHDISFSVMENFVAVASDTGTIHLFAMPGASQSGSSVGGDPIGGEAGILEFGKPQPAATLGNTKLPLPSFLGSVLPLPKYFSSEWSFAKVRLPFETPRGTLTFLESVLCPDGSGGYSETLIRVFVLTDRGSIITYRLRSSFSVAEEGRGGKPSGTSGNSTNPSGSDVSTFSTPHESAISDTGASLPRAMSSASGVSPQSGAADSPRSSTASRRSSLTTLGMMAESLPAVQFVKESHQRFIR